MELHLRKDLSNAEIATLFGFIGGVVALTDTNHFRSRAYQNAATVIEQLPDQLHTMFLNDPDFDKLPAIGPTLQKKLVELFTTGTIKAFEEYVKDLPGGMLPLYQVHGIGVKKAYILSKHFKLNDPITAIPDLLKEAKSNNIQDLPGFGEKSQQELITALENHRTQKRIPYEEAHKIASELQKELITCEAVESCELLGSLRRHAHSVGDIDIGLVTDDFSSVNEFVKTMKNVERVIVAGQQVIRLMLKQGHQVDIKTVPKKEWGAFLQHYTGSKEHNIKLREFALKQDKSLSEHGIKIKDPHTHETILKTFETEEDFYAFLGLKWIDPTKRLGGEEIAQAQLSPTE